MRELNCMYSVNVYTKYVYIDLNLAYTDCIYVSIYIYTFEYVFCTNMHLTQYILSFIHLQIYLYEHIWEYTYVLNVYMFDVY